MGPPVWLLVIKLKIVESLLEIAFKKRRYMCLQLAIHVISQAEAIAEVAASRPHHIMWQ